MTVYTHSKTSRLGRKYKCLQWFDHVSGSKNSGCGEHAGEPAPHDGPNPARSQLGTLMPEWDLQSQAYDADLVWGFA